MPKITHPVVKTLAWRHKVDQTSKQTSFSSLPSPYSHKMDSEWVPPGPGFSEDWLGFRRSFTKRPSGRHYAQCKYCGTIMVNKVPHTAPLSPY